MNRDYTTETDHVAVTGFVPLTIFVALAVIVIVPAVDVDVIAPDEFTVAIDGLLLVHVNDA